MFHFVPAPIASRALCAAALLFVAAPGCGGDGEKAADDAGSGGIDVPVFEVGGSSDVATTQDTGTSEDADAVSPPADTASQDTGPDVSWPGGDGTCKPDCKGKTCGPDGCGSVCGFCPTGKVCLADGSACDEFCKPQCEGKSCGDNGCGGNCGDCGSGFHCGVDFLCYADDCIGSCASKTCGDDGCGKSCGSCATGDWCAPDFQCKPTACKGIPPNGQCDGDILFGCEGQGGTAKKTQKDCSAQLPVGNKVCGWDPTKSAYGCIDKPPCEPSCKTEDGKTMECGDDGCGGSCGGCPSGWACSVGVCQAKVGGACGGTFNSKTGACDGDQWLFCSSDKIVALDCTKANKKCVWTGTAYGCK
ncbi:MAG: hypothetical protein H6747_06135 [Deltaproteobacteria bacterium]|nr:hypothetical protein [Deltaproteobacteria bacterium]